nr:MAG: ORF1 [Torque teno midi virus]
MPFWWTRRRKPWYTTWRNRRFRRKRKRTYGRRRRKPRRFARRRRRRRRPYKVRRKKKKITIQQWQPDRILKCKIKGYSFLVCGSQGNQYRCYTDDKLNYGQPKAPGGGGFGVEQYTLQFLFKEWQAHKNIWTTSNDYTDLVRYTGCKIILFRHPTTDFIVWYDRQPPFDFKINTYTDTHPLRLLLNRHHKVIRSLQYNTRQKPYVKLNIKPPKQMITKWFFQPDFATVPLFRLVGSACNFGYSLYGPNTQSPNLTLYALNIDFYKYHNWGNNTLQTLGYMPYASVPRTTSHHLIFKTPKKNTSVIFDNVTYKDTVSYEKGWFQPGVLAAYQVVENIHQEVPLQNRPVAIGRYNPEDDDGIGNRIWLISIVNNDSWQQPSDRNLIIGELPLYMAFWGIWDTVIKLRKTEEWLKTSMFVVKSKAIKIVLGGFKQDTWPFIDWSFIQGKMPWDEELTLQEKANWYPTCYKQQGTINAFVECGPLCPKYSYLPSSTWQLPYKYIFYFKWGGPQTGEKIIQDPQDQEKYPVPDKFTEILQIHDPGTQHCQSLLRPWDFRRGYITTTALKRMQDHLPIDESEQSDVTEPPKKKKKITTQIPVSDEEQEEIQTCLQSLQEKDSFPEQTQDIQQLIQYQHKKQQQLKHNIYKLLLNIKKSQAHLQMQTGLL